MTGQRLPSDRMQRRARWIVANPVLYALLVGVGIFVMGLLLLPGDVAVPAAMGSAGGIGNWLLWRPGGYYARHWTKRFAELDGTTDDIDPDWAPPDVPPPPET